MSFFRSMLRPVSALVVALAFVSGCRAMPEPLKMVPANPGLVVQSGKAFGLVPVQQYDATIKVRLPYATPDNAFKKILYPPGFPALAAEPTARKLAAAQKALKPHGLQILVLDAYRPPEVQWQLFQMFRDDKFVADPRKKWSKHCYGRAVDLTLTDLSGKVLEMPSAFDDFSPKAAAAYTGPDKKIRRRLTLLQSAMTAAGFSLYADEWWHFNDLSDPAALTKKPVSGKDLGLAVGG